MTQSLRILVADDHEFIRRGIRAVIEKRPKWEVVAEASSGAEALEAAGRLRPEIAILDISMPGLNGLEVTRGILQTTPETAVLILTMHDSEEIVRKVLVSGARGYLLKTDAAWDLIGAVECIAEGRPYFSPKFSELLVSGFARVGEPLRQSSARITTREREILAMLAAGKSNKEIAAALHIRIRTVEAHRSNLMEKLNLHSVVDLVRYAITNRIAD